jgi:hypothetical protein
MAKRKSPSPTPPVDLDLRFKVSDQPPDPTAKRFDIFLIDTGWNTAVSKVVRSHMAAISSFEKQDTIYLLSAEQSIDIMKQAPQVIGHDPILLVYDLFAPPHRKSRAFRGFRLNLGLIKHPEQALARLQEFLRFIAVNRSVASLDTAVRRELHREGVDGIMKILHEATTELL